MERERKLQLMPHKILGKTSSKLMFAHNLIIIENSVAIILNKKYEVTYQEISSIMN